jgi:hypothetical protein
MAELKSLHEFNRDRRAALRQQEGPQPNGIACPNCADEMLDSNPDAVLLTDPLQKAIHCPTCQYKGYRVA